MLLLFILYNFLVCALAQFDVPDAKVEVLSPIGLRVSIPDIPGIKLFAFHGKINEEMSFREAGTLSRDILKAKNNRWTYYNPDVKLNKDDVLYFWTYVEYFDGKTKLGYPRDDQQYVVATELIATSTTTKPSNTTTTPSPSDDSCEETVTTLNGMKTCQGKLIFSETFENNVDPMLWNTVVKFAGSPDYEFVLYGYHKDTMEVTNNMLKITPVPTDDVYGAGFCINSEINLGENCTSIIGTSDCHKKSIGWSIIPPVLSSQINTKNKFSFKYGRIEIRAKLPEGDWIYPELYLNSKFQEYGMGYQSGQIRVAYISGNKDENSNLLGGCILGSSPAGRTYAMKYFNKGINWANEFHRYGMLWTPESITLTVDDHVYGNIFPIEDGFASKVHELDINYGDNWRSGTKFAPFDKEMYLTVGVGAGGHNFEERPDGTKPWINKELLAQKNFYRAQTNWKNTWGPKSSLHIDHIKVWAI